MQRNRNTIAHDVDFRARHSPRLTTRADCRRHTDERVEFICEVAVMLLPAFVGDQEMRQMLGAYHRGNTRDPCRVDPPMTLPPDTRMAVKYVHMPFA